MKVFIESGLKPLALKMDVQYARMALALGRICGVRIVTAKTIIQKGTPNGITEMESYTTKPMNVKTTILGYLRNSVMEILLGYQVLGALLGSA